MGEDNLKKQDESVGHYLVGVRARWFRSDPGASCIAFLGYRYDDDSEGGVEGEGVLGVL